MYRPCGGARRRAVHKDVYTPVLRSDGVGYRLAVGLLRNVAAHELGLAAGVVDFLLNLARQLFVDVGDDDRDARVREKARDASAYARRAPVMIAVFPFMPQSLFRSSISISPNFLKFIYVFTVYTIFYEYFI